MTPRAARLLRGTLLGSVATLLAALSHSWAGGVIPGALAIALGTVFASAVGTIALGRRPTLLRTSLAVALGQLAFHLVFSLIGGGATVSGLGGGHEHHLSPTLSTGPLAAVERGGLGMWLAHLAAGVLTVLYLRHLERHLWALLTRIALRPLQAFSLEVPAVSETRIPVRSPRVFASGRSLRHAISRRGPPLTAGA